MPISTCAAPVYREVKTKFGYHVSISFIRFTTCPLRCRTGVRTVRSTPADTRFTPLVPSRAARDCRGTRVRVSAEMQVLCCNAYSFDQKHFVMRRGSLHGAGAVSAQHPSPQVGPVRRRGTRGRGRARKGGGTASPEPISRDRAYEGATERLGQRSHCTSTVRIVGSKNAHIRGMAGRRVGRTGASCERTGRRSGLVFVVRRCSGGEGRRGGRHPVRSGSAHNQPINNNMSPVAATKVHTYLHITTDDCNAGLGKGVVGG